MILIVLCFPCLENIVKAIFRLVKKIVVKLDLAFLQKATQSNTNQHNTINQTVTLQQRR